MRLIDADAEIAKIEQEIQRINERIKKLKERQKEEPFNKCHNFEKELAYCYRNRTHCKAEICALKSYSTAYDVDKVVEQIKCNSQNIALLYPDDQGGDYEYADGIEVNRAVEIVRAGIKV